MEMPMILLGLMAGFLVLGLASFAWGVDSRESSVDDHKR